MTGKTKTAFSPVVVLALTTTAVVAMLGILFAASFGDDSGTKTTAGSNSYSVSAIGHKALVDAIKEMDIPVMVSQYRTQDRLDWDNSILMLLEPSVGEADLEEMTVLLEQSQVIYVLPKRQPHRRDLDNFRWLARVGFVDKERAERYARLIDKDAEVIRPDELEKDTPQDDDQTIEVGQVVEANQNDQENVISRNWTSNITGFEPEISDLQLIKSDEITPLISHEDGILVGSFFNPVGGTTFVISDPDLISNAGLGQGDNAKIFFHILNLMASGNSTIFVDETIHGFDRNPDLLRSALEYPFNYISFLAALFIAFLVWSAMQRFGSPPKLLPDYKTGKLVLVENGVNLLKHGNHKPEILARYVELMQHAMAKKLHAPRNLNDEEMVDWLDEYGAKHEVSLSLKTIKHRSKMAAGSGKSKTNTFMDHVHEKPLIQIVKYVEQWKQEMLDGSGSDKIN